MSEEINFQEQKINPDIWGTEEDWIDVANPTGLPYAISNYCAQSSQTGLVKMEAKIPYLKQNNWNAGTAVNDSSRAMWRGLFLADEYGPEENELEDVDKPMPTEDFPAVWGLGANSPMANSYFILPGYISGNNLQTESASVEYYYYGLNTEYSPSNYGTDVNDWHDAKTTPFCFTSQQSVAPYYAAQFGKRNFELPVNGQYTSFNGQFSGNPILSFNYQNVVIYPVVYVAKKNDNSAYGYDFYGPVNIETYFDGVNWDPENETGTPPLQQTYPYITSVCIGSWYMGPNDGTNRGMEGDSIFGGVAPGAFALHETQASEMLYKNQRRIWATQCISKIGDKNAYQSIQQSVLAGGIISGSKAGGATAYYTYTMQTNSRVDTDAKAFIAYTTDTASPSFPIFYQNGHYQPIIRQRTNPSNPNAPYTNYADFISLWENATKEEVLKDVAYAGFWFSENASSAARSATGEDCDDPKMHIPIFDEYGITTGEYKSGVEAALEDNAKWQDPFKDNPYKPGDGPAPGPTPGPEPIPSDNPMLPTGLNWTLANNGTGIWALKPSEITQVLDDIFGGDIDVEMFGNNPMNAILSLKWTPFYWEPTGAQSSTPIVLGNQVVNPLHTYPIIETASQAEKHGEGSCTFKFDKNFYNARYMQARLFLPFYGYYELPVSQLLSSSLRLDFYYNVPDELGVYVISYDNVIYDFIECSCDIEVPLTGSNAAAIAANKKSEALTIATQVASTALSSIAFIGTGGLSGVSEFASMAADAGGVIGGLQSLPYLYEAAPREAIRQVAGLTTGATLAGSTGANVFNTIHNARVERASLKTNLPYHGTALQTTFLHMSMKPYIQIFKNAIMEGLDTTDNNTVKVKLGGTTETQYKLKVGHACDIWDTLVDMPENSLCQTTGMSNMATTGMELAEIQELNQILMTGFYRGFIPG